MRSVLLAVVLLAVSAPSAPRAAPTMTLRARTSIQLDPIRRIEGGIRVTGTVVDPLTLDPIPYVDIEISLDERTDVVTADDDGRFTGFFDGLSDQHQLRVRFGGERSFAESSVELANFEATRRPLALTISVDLDDPGAAVISVRATSDQEGVSLVAEVLAGDASGDGLRELGPITTDSEGRGAMRLSPNALGPPGRKRLRVQFPGDEQFDPASAESIALRSTATAIDVTLDADEVSYESKAVGHGQLRDHVGAGIRNALLTVTSSGDELIEIVTDDDGSFSFSVPGSEIGAGTARLQVAFNSPKPWFSDSRSKPLTIQVGEPRPVPVGYTLAAFAATLLVLLSFVGLRTKPWQKWKWKRRQPPTIDRAHTEDGSVAPAPVKGGLSRARASFMSSVRRPHDHDFDGVCCNVINSVPVPACRVSIAFEGTTLETMTDTHGAFSFTRLPPGRWNVHATAQGFVTEAFAIDVPHHGEFRSARIDLVPVRERIFDMYRLAALPHLPSANRWGIWTPRQIVDHVRQRAAASTPPALGKLTDVVEETYFSQRIPPETLIPQVADLVSAAVAESSAMPRT